MKFTTTALAVLSALSFAVAAPSNEHSVGLSDVKLTARAAEALEAAADCWCNNGRWCCNSPWAYYCSRDC